MKGFRRWASEHGATIAAIGTIGGLVIAIVSAAFAYLAWSATYEVAERSGQLDKGEARLSLAGVALSPVQRTAIVYVQDFKKAQLTVCDLTLMISNIGKKTIKGLALIIR